MRNPKGPDFICIGAQKAGTTWLYENLNGHPDVWMPPVKEFHYFNRVRANEALLGDWDMPHPDGIYNRYIKQRFPPSLTNIRWLKQYYRYGLSKKWYLSLFDEKPSNQQYHLHGVYPTCRASIFCLFSSIFHYILLFLCVWSLFGRGLEPSI